jgi:hypothetical protein
MPNIVVYAYYEGNQMYIDNLTYFLDFGYLEDLFYIIVVNGDKISVNIPDKKNIIVINRPNTFYDFGGYIEGINYVLNNNISYEYMFFLNGSCRGPFLPHYYKCNWLEPYINISVEDDAVIVGSTINIYHGKDNFYNNENHKQPHCQTYAFLLKKEFIEKLITDKFFVLSEQMTKWDIICKCEIGMSLYAIKNNFNISCLIPEYRINYLDISKVPINPYALTTTGDIVFNGKLCYNRLLHPYEYIYPKTNRMDMDIINSLTHANYIKYNPTSKNISMIYRNFTNIPIVANSIPNTQSHNNLIQISNNSKKTSNKIKLYNYINNTYIDMTNTI